MLTAGLCCASMNLASCCLQEWQWLELRSLTIDFRRACDKIYREAIWEALNDAGVPEHIKLIKALYEEAESSVRFKGKHHEKFTINKGFGQNCSLSPLPFLIVLGPYSLLRFEQILYSNFKKFV